MNTIRILLLLLGEKKAKRVKAIGRWAELKADVHSSSHTISVL